MSLIPSRFLDPVVPIGVRAGGSEVRYTATGFVYTVSAGRSEDGHKLYVTFLVTNRHVAEGASELHVRHNYPSGHTSAWSPLREQWTMHPDPDVDVAVMPFHSEDGDGNPVSVPSFVERHRMPRTELVESEFREGNEIFVLGFPLGLAGDSKNYPIVRQGIVARVHDWYDGEAKVFLIDSSIFPGNSGGPVLAKPTIHTYGKAISTAKLIGMVSGYVQYKDISGSDSAGRPVLAAQENSGLAIVVPIDAIDEAIAIVVDRHRAEQSGR